MKSGHHLFRFSMDEISYDPSMHYNKTGKKTLFIVQDRILKFGEVSFSENPSKKQL